MGNEKPLLTEGHKSIYSDSPYSEMFALSPEALAKRFSEEPGQFQLMFVLCIPGIATPQDRELFLAAADQVEDSKKRRLGTELLREYGASPGRYDEDLQLFLNALSNHNVDDLREFRDRLHKYQEKQLEDFSKAVQDHHDEKVAIANEQLRHGWGSGKAEKVREANRDRDNVIERMRDRLEEGHSEKVNKTTVKDVVAAVARLRNDYLECVESLAALSHQVHDAIADELTPRMNKHLQQMPQDTYEEKQSLASWVNSELRHLNLAIRCPKTGKPATLVADIRGGEDQSSRFRLDVRGDDGRHQRTLTSNTLPVLELMEDEPRREGLARRQSGPRR